MQIYGLIPSRLKSTRLPEKALLDIHGYPMVVHVAKRSQESKKLDRVVVCTDSHQIADVCHRYNIQTCMTSEEHVNGTDRIAEAFQILGGKDDDIIIDIQGDEPLVEAECIDGVIEKTIVSEMDIVIPYQNITVDSLTKPKIVESGNKIIYMSRAQIPYPFRLENEMLKSQLCIIGFKAKALMTYYNATNKPSYLETIEGIELIRALELGLRLETFYQDGESLSVDVHDDYLKILELSKGNIYDY